LEAERCHRQDSSQCERVAWSPGRQRSPVPASQRRVRLHRPSFSRLSREKRLGLALEVGGLLGLLVGALAGAVALLLRFALLLLEPSFAAQRGVVGEVAGGLLRPA